MHAELARFIGSGGDDTATVVELVTRYREAGIHVKMISGDPRGHEVMHPPRKKRRWELEAILSEQGVTADPRYQKVLAQLQ